MTWALDSKSLTTHITNASMPTNYAAGSGVTASERWTQGEATVKQVIAASVPDSIFMRIKGGTGAKEVWDALKQLYEGRTKMIVVDLRRKIQSMKCGEDDNVRTHFDSIADLREQLAAMGTTIPDDEYASILLGSIPTSFEPSVSAMSTTIELTGVNLTPNMVIKLITDEYDRRVLKSGKPGGQDESLTADAGKKKSKKDIECFNCKKRGHIKAECYAKGGGQEGNWPKKQGRNGGQDSAASADQQSQADIQAWVVIDEGTKEIAEEQG